MLIFQEFHPPLKTGGIAMLKNFKISKKLLVGFVTILIITTFLGAFGLYELSLVKNETNKITTNWLPAVYAISDMNTNTSDFRIQEYRHILTYTDNGMDEVERDMKSLLSTFNKHKVFYETTISQDEERRLWESMNKNWDNYLLEHEKLMKVSRKNLTDSARKMMSESKKLFDDASSDLIKLVELNNRGGQDATISVNSVFSSAFVYISVIILICIAIGILIATFTARLISSGIIKIKKAAQEIAEGDFSGKLSIDSEDEIGELAKSFQQMKQALGLLIEDTNMLVDNAVQGKLTVRADTSRHYGEYKKIIKGVNSTLDSVVNPLNVAAKYIDQISKGNIPAKIEETYFGDFNFIKTNLNQCIDAINLLIEDTNMLSVAAIEGKLGARANAQKHTGDYRKIVEGVNNTLDAVVGPLNVAADYVAKISIGEIPPVITQHYNGEFNQIKNNLNLLIGALSQIIEKAKLVAKGDLTIVMSKRSDKDELIQALIEMVDAIAYVVAQVQNAADNVASGSVEMSATTEQLTQGASEQASAAEEVSSSMDQMVANINQNSDNAQQTERIALKAATDIQQSSKAVEQTVVSMKNIADKISVVSEIANKIDLLAINAAIEAARAGEHGKGFAVVAGEVRKLAERSQTAAIQINEMSKSSVVIAEKSGILLAELVPDIQKTARLVQEIAASSIEQNSGASQVNNAIQQLNQVTQQNAASAEELSTNAEELSSMAESLKETISFFKTNQQKDQESKQNRPSSFKKTSKIAHINLSNEKNRGVKLNLDQRKPRENDYESF